MPNTSSSGDQLDNEIEIVVFRKSGGPLTKRVWQSRSGKVNADGSDCRMSEGWAWRTQVDGVAHLAELIEELDTDEALALGRLRAGLPTKVRVVLRKQIDEAGPPDVIARTTDYLTFVPSLPAFMLLDHDRKNMPPEIATKLKRAGTFWRALTQAVPALTGAAYVSRQSTSASLYHRDTDKWVSRSSGEHDYIVVRDGTDIERALKTLHDRLWLAGYGYFVIGAAGQLLDRSIIDNSVFGPERLVFEGPPIVEPPLAQDHDERRPRAHDGVIIDTMTAIPALTAEELARLNTLKVEAAVPLRPLAAAQRRVWVDKFAQRRGLSTEEAERVAAQATSHLLEAQFELTFDDPDLGNRAIAEVLADPDKFIGETLADPLEGTAYGRGKAKVMRRRNGHLIIHSFAHGGVKYQLAGQGVTLDDFFSYAEQHNYIFAPNRALWPASTVDARIPPVTLLDTNRQPMLDAKGNPIKLPASRWLDQNRPVEQITWAPGRPMLIEERLIAAGGWIARPGVRCFNLYLPPEPDRGNPGRAGRWLDHVDKVFPDDADHIIFWLAQRVQRPEEKINHALLLGGAQGIGKDTLLEPVKRAVGPWNFQEVSPQQIMGRFNGFLKSVILRVSEARDLGDFDRFSLCDHLKTLTAAPPDVLRVDEKNIHEHSIPNVCGVIITTNHKTDGIYLPADDRRHYVAWSDLTKEAFPPDYWTQLWRWYENGGAGHVAAYLRELDLSSFDAKAPPTKTAAFWAIVDVGRAPEDAALFDALDSLGNPAALTLSDIIGAARGDLQNWLIDHKNRRTIPHRLEDCGYTQVRNPAPKDGYWVVNGKRQVIYARKGVTQQERLRAALELSAAEGRRLRHARQDRGGNTVGRDRR